MNFFFSKTRIRKILFLVLPFGGLAVIFFNVKIKTPIEVVKYRAGEYVYSNRPYIDSSFSSFFDGFDLLKLERHQEENIFVFVADTAIAYRLIPETEKKEIKWEPTDLTVRIIGITSVLTSAVSKKIAPGLHQFVSGGSNEAWPIFIKTKNSGENKTYAYCYKKFSFKNIKFEILNFYENNKYPPVRQINFYFYYFRFYFLLLFALLSIYVWFVVKFL